jgi:hypothetical protein
MAPNDLFAFISQARQLHPPYTCSALPEEFIATEEVQVDGRYHGDRVRYVVVEKYDYINIMCEQCGSGRQTHNSHNDVNVHHRILRPRHDITHQPVLLQTATTSSSGAAWWMKLMIFEDEVDEVGEAIEMENSIRFAR